MEFPNAPTLVSSLYGDKLPKGRISQLAAAAVKQRSKSLDATKSIVKFTRRLVEFFFWRTVP